MCREEGRTERGGEWEGQRGRRKGGRENKRVYPVLQKTLLQNPAIVLRIHNME